MFTTLTFCYSPVSFTPSIVIVFVENTGQFYFDLMATTGSVRREKEKIDAELCNRINQAQTENVKFNYVIMAKYFYLLHTWFRCNINSTMGVVIYHSTIVIPKNVQWILDVFDNPTCESQQ